MDKKIAFFLVVLMLTLSLSGCLRNGKGGSDDESGIDCSFGEDETGVSVQNDDFETEVCVQYGDYEEEYFLLWRNETSVKRPIVIWAHQGGGHPNNFQDEALDLNLIDVHALSWGSRSKESYTTQDQIDALAKGVLDWVIANAEEYRIDTDQIIISGQSRGSGYSWHLAYNDDPYPGIKGVYMANGLGQKVSESLDLTGNITPDSPPIFFTWKEGAGLNGDSHTQDGANAVIDKYDDLGISDRVLGYELDNNDLYQYLPNFAANVLNL